MPLEPHTCLSVTCDVCGAGLTDWEADGIMHFGTEAEARETARALGWPVTSGGLICPEDDPAHQAAMDELLPVLTFVPDGQTAIDDPDVSRPA